MEHSPVNAVLRIENGIAYLDVSTKKYPDTIALINESDLCLALDGGPRWRAAKIHNVIYVLRQDWRTRKMELLHRKILGLLESKMEGDHKNHNGLDNTRANLRVATRSENQRNRRATRGSSAYLGVSFHKASGKWRACCNVAPKQIHIGLFDIEEDAARAYDHAAILHYGQFASLNFPPPMAV